MPSLLARAAVVTAVVLGLGSVSCGAEDGSDAAKAAAKQEKVAAQECRDQWRDVAANLVGLDEDPLPSALGKRWENVLATVTIYEDTATGEKCQETIETLTQAITALRQFSVRLRPYDMEFQVSQVRDEVAQYLAASLPPAKRVNKKLVKPPTKAAVTSALATLSTTASAANADLAPAWGQLEAVSLDDTAAVTSALADLAFFAKDSTNWVTCSKALKVIGMALTAGQATSATPSSTPSAGPSSTSAPAATPTAPPDGAQ